MAVSISVAGTCRKSQEYIKKSNIPEIYIGADYKNGGLLAGVGIEMISLKPRTQSSWEDPRMIRAPIVPYLPHVSAK